MNSSADRPLSLPLLLRLAQRFRFPRKLGLCERMFGRFLSRQGIAWVRTSPGPVWKLDLANATHRWIVYGDYEGSSFWNWLRVDPARFGTIVDSGANIGQTVLYFATLLPDTRIIAYEPGRFAREWLAAGVAANRFGRVEVEASALGANAGAARLAAQGAPDRHGSWNTVSQTEGEPITIAALDTELDRLGIAVLDLWKVDMEGYEGAALTGAERALSAHRIRAIYIEAAGESGPGNLDRLARHGYRIHGIALDGRLTPWNPAHSHENALCLAPGS